MRRAKINEEFRKNWIKVHSSNLSAIKYDPENEILYVKFVEGHIYSYSGVTENTYGNLLAPGVSVGKIFARDIRDSGLYDAKKISKDKDVTVFSITEEELT